MCRQCTLKDTQTMSVHSKNLLAYGIGHAVHNVSIVEHDIKEPWNIIILTRWENQTF